VDRLPPIRGSPSGAASVIAERLASARSASCRWCVREPNGAASRWSTGGELRGRPPLPLSPSRLPGAAGARAPRSSSTASATPLTSRHFFLCVSSFDTKAQAFHAWHGYRQVGQSDDDVTDGASELLLYKSVC
jgi:hypothetical protein